MRTIKGMFTLSGLVAFLLGVFLAAWVKSTASSVQSKVGG